MIEAWLRGAVTTDETDIEIKGIFHELTTSLLEPGATAEEKVTVLHLPESDLARKRVERQLVPLRPIIAGQNQLQVNRSAFIRYVYETHRVPLLLVSKERKELLLGIDASLAPLSEAPPGKTQTSFVPTHDYFRPGTTATCVGCHRGHMINSKLTFAVGQTNLARLARASASSSLDSFNYASFRVKDNLLTDERGYYDWASKGEKTPWIRLDWDSPVTISEVVLYPRTAKGNYIEQATLQFSDGSILPVPGFREDGSPLKLSFTPRQVSWLLLKVQKGVGPSMGVAEVMVHGENPVTISKLPPSSPRGLKATQGTVLLAWAYNLEPDIAGYRVYSGTSPGQYSTSVDVGNVNSYLLTGLEDGQVYYFAVKAYNLGGMDSGDFSTEVSATFRTPKLAWVSADRGPSSGNTEVTLGGQYLAPRGLTVLFGDRHARVVSTRLDSVTVLTPPHQVGVMDITLINPDGSGSTLHSAFTYVRP